MNLFRKDPVAKAKAEYERLLKAAMEAQRAGDVVRSAELHAAAEKLYAEKLAPNQ